MGVLGIEETGVESGFVAEKKEAFRIGIQPTQWINVFGEAKFGKGTVG
jgi:hypothetical protein